MHSKPAILSNMAFRQSPVWNAETATICGEGETPDTLGAWRQAVRLLRARSRYDVVVTMGARPSLAYGLLCAVLGLPSRQIMTEVFLDAPRPRSFLWRFKTALYGWISRRATGILTNSSAETVFIARRFRVSEAKVRFVPMHTTIADPDLSTSDGGYVLSIGRTLRDLDTFASVAKQIDFPIILVVGALDEVPAGLPPTVQVLRDVPLSKSHDLLRNATVVALPLLPAERSTGQVVFLEAMAMGKPVVATQVTGTADYLHDGDNALLAAPGDAIGFARALNRLLTDPHLRQRLAAKALEECRTHWMPDQHAARKLEAIQELWNASPARRSPPIS